MGKKIVTFSLDDGIKQDIRVMEILNKYGLKGTFNINTGIATEASKWVYKGSAFESGQVKVFPSRNTP